MKKPKSSQGTVEKKLAFVRKYQERREFRNALSVLWDDPNFKVFFRHFLKHCNVTRTRFESDPYKIVEQEATRRLAMSYLHILAQDDPEHLLGQLEQELKHKHT